MTAVRREVRPPHVGNVIQDLANGEEERTPLDVVCWRSYHLVGEGNHRGVACDIGYQSRFRCRIIDIPSDIDLTRGTFIWLSNIIGQQQPYRTSIPLLQQLISF